MKSIIPPDRQSDRDRVKQLFLGEDTYATSLIALVLDRYGTEALDWHPSSIRMQLEQDLGYEIPKASFDKIMAAVTLMTTNMFFRDVGKFVIICNVLAGDDFDPTVFDPADAAECAWGITEGMLLWPEDGRDPFSEEIVAYVSQVLKSEGFVQAPDVLRIATSPEQEDRIRSDFADDPDMFGAIWQSQRSRADEITETVKARLKDLLMELKTLPLQNGNVEELAGRVGTWAD